MPGIGKTTLADLLLYSHLEQGFKPVVIQDGLADARRMFEKNTKQIFYFDDFLGQTFLHDRPDMLGGNQDAALVTFMEAVSNTQHSRFILTTREHILGSALTFSGTTVPKQYFEPPLPACNGRLLGAPTGQNPI